MTQMLLEHQKHKYSISFTPGGTRRVVCWRLFHQRNQCGINIMSIIFTSTKMKKFQKAFRNCFHLPYNQYLELVEDICLNKLFDRWCGYKSNNKKVVPVELLLLRLFHYLRHGWTFNNCEESTAIDKDVHRVFFRVFLEFGSTVLYKKWVLTPVNFPEAWWNMKEYSVARFPGCIQSSDCTHSVTEWCEYNLKIIISGQRTA